MSKVLIGIGLAGLAVTGAYLAFFYDKSPVKAPIVPLVPSKPCDDANSKTFGQGVPCGDCKAGYAKDASGRCMPMPKCTDSNSTTFNQAGECGACKSGYVKDDTGRCVSVADKYFADSADSAKQFIQDRKSIIGSDLVIATLNEIIDTYVNTKALKDELIAQSRANPTSSLQFIMIAKAFEDYNNKYHPVRPLDYKAIVIVSGRGFDGSVTVVPSRPKIVRFGSDCHSNCLN